MTGKHLLAFAVAFIMTIPAWTTSAMAADPFGPPIDPAQLDQRGGTDTGTVNLNNSLAQANSTDQTSSNSGSISISNDAAKFSGGIGAASMMTNQGITTLMQNTGDLVNLSNSTSVNVYLH